MKKNVLFYLTFILNSFGFYGLAQTFNYVDSGTDYLLSDLSIPPNQNNVAYAAGSQYTTENSPGVIVKSTDGGLNWNTVYSGSNNIQVISFLDNNIGYAGGYNGSFLKTTDGGVTWEESQIADNIYLYISIDFYDNLNGYVAAYSEEDGMVVYLTNNGGTTWYTASQSPLLGQNAFTYADENTLYSVGNGNSVYKSSDAGNTWQLIFSQAGTNINMGVAFKDANHGVYSGEDGDIYLTNDGGISWQQVLYTGYHFFDGMAYKGNQIIAAGTDETVYLSNDNGETWQVVWNGSGQSALNDVAFFENNSGLICGSQGKIIRFDDLILGQHENTWQQNVSIYPNPVEDFINFKNYQTIKNVEILNTSGQILKKISNLQEIKKINTNTLQTGVYFIRITQTNGQKSVLKFLKK